VNSNRYQRNLQYRCTVQNFWMANIAFKGFSLLSLLKAPELSETINSTFHSLGVTIFFFWLLQFPWVILYRVFTHRRKIFQTSLNSRWVTFPGFSLPFYWNKNWGCVILREIDFLLKICWSIPCLHPSWKVHIPI